jgi:hypothetical protein
VVSACADPSATGLARQVPASSKSLVSRALPLTIDDEFAALSDSIPGFGGWFVDANGQPTVYLRDPNVLNVAEGRLRARVQLAVRNSAGVDGNRLAMRQGAYDFRQLYDWKQIAETILATERAAVFVDANEALNRVQVAISDAAAAGSISERLQEQGVPKGAVVFTVVDPVRLYTDLSDRIRPIPAGVQLWSSPAGPCTLGFSASQNPEGPMGFVTNSHCTAAFGNANASTIFYQNNSPHPIGLEIEDPSPWQLTPGCIAWVASNPTGICRFSDAAFVDYRYVATDSVDFGYIARTLSRGAPGVSGSKTIDPNNRHFEIASKYYSVPTGVYIESVGITNGWTTHLVTNSCNTVIVPGSKLLWCQVVTNGKAGPGDSGKPMFGYDYCDDGQLQRPDGTKCVRLAGIVWGGSGSSIVYVSPILGIEYDMGGMAVRPADKP